MNPRRPSASEQPGSHAEIDARIRQTVRQVIGSGIPLIPVLLSDASLSYGDTGRGRFSRHGRTVADDVPASIVQLISARRGGDDGREPVAITPELGRLWQLGLIYLKDKASRVDERARITATTSILLNTTVAANAVIRGELAVFDGAVIQENTVIEGPGVLTRTLVDANSFLSRLYFIQNSFIGQYVKCQVGVIADGTMIAAHAAVDGGTHPELYPLTRDGSIPTSVILERGTWIGHHVSLTAGARIGAGSVVAAFTHVDGPFGTNVMIAGSPARSFPLDFHIRSLSPDEARQAGANQGYEACEFPMYGRATIGWQSDRRLEIDFPEHAHLNSEAGNALLDFQRGALETTFRALLPGYKTTLSCQVGETVRFAVDLDQPVRPMTALTTGTVVTRSSSALPADLLEIHRRILDLVPAEGVAVGELLERLNQLARDSGLPLTDQLPEVVCQLSQQGRLEPVLMPSLFSPYPMCQLFEQAIANPSGFPPLAPLQPGRPVRSSLPSPEAAGTTGETRARVENVVAGLLGSSVGRIPEDLTLAGLSSMHVVELFLRLEAEFDMELADSALSEVKLTLSGITGLISRGQNRQSGPPVAPRPTRRSAPAQGDALPNVDLTTWCQQDIATVLARHIQSPPTPWIFKFLRSDKPNDYDYLTWKDLGRRAKAAQKSLAAAGVTTGDVVTLILPQSPSLAAHWAASIFLGAVPNICASPNPKLTDREFATWFGKVIVQSHSRCIVCAPDSLAQVRKCLDKEALGVPLILPAEPPADHDPSEPDFVAQAPASAAILQHSSGTTGLKKAVVLSHEQVLNQAWVLAEALECSTADKLVSWLPLYHDMGFIGSFVFSLLWSIPTVLMSPFDWVRRPDLLLEQISEESATLCWMPNFGFMHCANAISERKAGTYDLSAVRCIINASEPVTAQAIDRFMSRFKAAGLRATAPTPLYGMAEYTMAATQCPPRDPPKIIGVNRELFTRSGKVAQDDSAAAMRLVSSGRPLRDVTLEVVAEDGTPVADGTVGEIRLKGPCLIREYYHDPVSTREALREGYYYSGDLGFLMDGELYVTGRKKDLIIVGGHNLYPHEIEEALNALDQIKPGRVVAFAVFDDNLGTEELVVAAELKPGNVVSSALEEEIRRLISAQFDVTPIDICLFSERVLAKSTSGKISRSRCRDQYVAGSLGQAGPDT